MLSVSENIDYYKFAHPPLLTPVPLALAAVALVTMVLSEDVDFLLDDVLPVLGVDACC